VLEIVLADLSDRLGETDPVVEELESIITAIGYLPLRTETDPVRIRVSYREKGVIRSRIASLVQSSDICREAIERALTRVNGIKGDAPSFEEMECLLADQPYRLSYWRVAADEINYRRFFDINELAAIRVEDPIVFAAVHEKALEYVRAGWVTGLRIDHPDGLSNPVQYFRDLQAACGEAIAASGNKTFDRTRPLYVVAEKIMMGDERPRRTWAVHGTTGYGFLNELNGLFVDPGAHKPLVDFYQSFTGERTDFADLIYFSKRLILRVSMSSELNVLARRLDRICQQHRHTRDFTLDSLRFALREIISCFPVYRTYIREDQREIDADDRRHIEFAIAEAGRRNPAVSSSVFDAIKRILLVQDPEGISDEHKAERRLFVMRFQQLTGPVTAKGVEDTAFYRRFPLASLNEVGGEPDAFGLTPDAFHARILARYGQWPHNMLTTSTHDTKRGEDVRARLNVLSEIPGEWAGAVVRWHGFNRRFRSSVNGDDFPERNTEYLLYQTLVGTLPVQPLANDNERAAYTARIQEYMQKAAREAKTHTSWINPDADYDRALARFIEAALTPGPQNKFLSDIESFAASITAAGLMNSVSQVVFKFLCPGVPDLYQGNELWDFSLVDPDNRRPVDFARRRQMLSEIDCVHTPEFLRSLLSHPHDGRVKLYITHRLMHFRRDNQAFFLAAPYVPLSSIGDQRMHAVSFARTAADRIVVAAAGRFFVRLGCRSQLPVGDEVWRDSALVLPNDRSDLWFRNIFSGRIVKPAIFRGRSLLPLSDVFADLPVAVLESVVPR
jgi:(1->4)-alpha-D-glucan 1-alpha-D-glucosylmutase